MEDYFRSEFALCVSEIEPSSWVIVQPPNLWTFERLFNYFNTFYIAALCEYTHSSVSTLLRTTYPVMYLSLILISIIWVILGKCHYEIGLKQD